MGRLSLSHPTVSVKALKRTQSTNYDQSSGLSLSSFIAWLLYAGCPVCHFLGIWSWSPWVIWSETLEVRFFRLATEVKWSDNASRCYVTLEGNLFPWNNGNSLCNLTQNLGFYCYLAFSWCTTSIVRSAMWPLMYADDTKYQVSCTAKYGLLLP